MAVFDLGYTPNHQGLVLSEGGDFICTLTEDGVTWPASTTCTLSFPDLVGIGPYSATVTISTGTASFVVDKTATTEALIPGGSKYRIHLSKAGTQDFLWFYGAVKRKE